MNVSAQHFGVRTEKALLAIVQECLSNAFQHAKPNSVNIEIERTANETLLLVENDGGKLADNSESSGFGIRGMRERATNLGGWLTVVNSENGVVVNAGIPIESDFARRRTLPTERGAANENFDY